MHWKYGIYLESIRYSIEQQTLMIFHEINRVNKFKQHAWSRMLISNMLPVYDGHIFVTCLSSFFFPHKSICIFWQKQIYWRDIWCIYYSSINMQSILQSAVSWLMITEKRNPYNAKAINLLYFIIMSLECMLFPT